MDSINDQEKKWLLEEKYLNIKTDTYKKECLLIDTGTPVAYLIGNIEFLGCKIDLEYRPLIPRAETEFWVDIFIKKNQKKNIKDPLHVLDLFSGSGCIGIAIQKYLNAYVDFGEIDDKNIKQIKKNIFSNIQYENMNIYKSDVFLNIPRKKYNFIVANPPYIDRTKVSQVQVSVLENEDDHALFADQQGLKFVYQLIDEGFRYLKKEGEIWVEFDPWQVNLINIHIKKNQRWDHFYLKDQYNKDRVLILRLRTI